MDGLIRILREFPAIWMAIGLIVSAIVAYLVAKKFTPIMVSTVGDIADMHKTMVESYKVQIAEFKIERNDYRDKLHEEKQAHQATLLLLTDLQARPNVDQVYKGQQDFFQRMSGHMDEQTKTMKLIHESIVKHDQGVEKRAKEVVSQIVSAVNGKTA